MVPMTLAEAKEIISSASMPMTAEELRRFKQALHLVSSRIFGQ